MRKGKVTVRCDEHPRYTAKRDPRADCLVCWKIRAAFLKKEIETLKTKIKELKNVRR